MKKKNTIILLKKKKKKKNKLLGLKLDGRQAPKFFPHKHFKLNMLAIKLSRLAPNTQTACLTNLNIK